MDSRSVNECPRSEEFAFDEEGSLPIACSFALTGIVFLSWLRRFG